MNMNDYFYGWYMKCRSQAQTLAVIPAVHQVNCRSTTCSVQIITDDGTWNIDYSAGEYRKKGSCITIGKSRFSEKGYVLSINTPELDIRGKVRFGSLSPLKYDIMGPFALVPFMECRHSVFCHMAHSCFQLQRFCLPDVDSRVL